MKVRVAELQRISQALFDHLERRGYDAVELPHDYYWEINAAQRYDPTKDPSDFTLGQISHDLERVREIASRNADPVAFALVWLSAVLRQVGEETLG